MTAKTTVSKSNPKKKKEKEESSDASYDKLKDFHGQKYTGMKIGRSHTWHYDPGTWKEKKITPDEWEFSFAVTKRRAGHAPEGSGAPVGTDYHWYILADQSVEKLDANSYSTNMHGYKFKLAHKRADSGKWSLSDKGQRKKMIKILQKMIEDLQEQAEEENAEK